MNENKLIESLKKNVSSLGSVAHIDLFCATELASHERIVWVELDQPLNFELEPVLAWIFKKETTRYHPEWLNNLEKITFTPIKKDKIEIAISMSLKAIETSEYTSNKLIVPISTDSISESDTMLEIKGLKLYMSGPTYTYIWWNDTRLCFLESHWES